jgi:NAD(P) transhydrogenase subunit alpha
LYYLVEKSYNWFKLQNFEEGIMRIGIPKEIAVGERRVALSPETVRDLKKLNLDIVIESNAGFFANYSDQDFIAAGAQISNNPQEIWQTDLVLKVRPPENSEIDLIKDGGAMISFIYPSRNPQILEKLKNKKVSVLAMDMVPRISRAQKMDALSSMANIAGYKAVIEAANNFGSLFTGQITAAGKIPPAKVLVIGAGVAGLAAIGAAKSLGAIVRAFDTRPEVADQVKSMGGEFLEIDFKEDGTGEGGYAKIMGAEFIKKEMELFKNQASEVDIIITTALVPGAKAPILLLKEAVEAMKPGSIIVDMASEQGGNCELTKPGEIYVHNGVKIIGYTDLPSRLPTQASKLYGTNMAHFLKEMKINEGLKIDVENEVIRGALVTHLGEITFPPPKPKVVAKPPAKKVESHPVQKIAKKTSPIAMIFWIALFSIMMLALGIYAPAQFLSHFTVFVLACFVGWQLIWNVSPSLHTPLMAVTNAISGIIVLGSMLQISGPMNSLPTMLAIFATTIACINIAGGFFVTKRMLKMFRK